MSSENHAARDAWPAGVAFAVNGGLYGGLLSRYAELSAGFNATPAVFGAILTAGALGGLTGSILAPVVMRTRNIAVATAIAGIAFSLLSATLAFAPTSVVAAVLFFLIGTADGGHDVSMNALTVEFQQRLGIPIMGRAHAIWSLALAAGAAIGALAAASGIPPTVHLTIVSVLYAGLQLSASRHARREMPDDRSVPPSGHREGGSTALPAFAALRGPLVLTVAVTAVAASYIEGPGQDWSAILLANEFGVSAGFAAAAPFALSAGLVASRLSMDALRQRLNSRVLAALASGLVASAGLAGYAASTFGLPAWLALAVFVAIGLGTGPVYPMLFDTTKTISARYGISVITTSGIISTCSRIGAITAPTVVGQLAGVSGVSIIFVIVAIAGAVTALGLPFALKG